MTIYHIFAPDELKASITLPASKSISNRALIINALCKNSTTLLNLSSCDDTDVVIKALSERKRIINVGAAGTAMRFLTACLAGQHGSFVIAGTERMNNRPIRLLVESLQQVGAYISYIEKEGFPPLHIEGHTLTGGEISLDGSVSSQYISALLMVAPAMTKGLRLHLTGAISSKPYIDMTIALMRHFGAAVFEAGQSFIVPAQSYSPVDHFTVEPDWSAASYWYEMMALSKDRNASVTLQGLRCDSIQGDASIVELFDRLGVSTSFHSSGITLAKKRLTSEMICLFQFDFTDMPDMAQTVAVTCAMLHIPFHFTGLHSLKIKETDRLFALQTELRKLGYVLDILNDNALQWHGERCEAEPSPVIATYEDHRMAMAFAPVALCLDAGICIAHPEVVSKSYPKFWDDLKSAHFSIKN